MSLKVELTLPEYAGQRCDVKICIRSDGGVYFTFEHSQPFGYPSLELRQLRKLLEMSEALSEAST